MSNEDKVKFTESQLKEFSQKLIKLEKDLTTPGSSTSETNRIDRLLKFFEEDEILKWFLKKLTYITSDLF